MFPGDFLPLFLAGPVSVRLLLLLFACPSHFTRTNGHASRSSWLARSTTVHLQSQDLLVSGCCSRHGFCKVKEPIGKTKVRQTVFIKGKHWNPSFWKTMLESKAQPTLCHWTIVWYINSTRIHNCSCWSCTCAWPIPGRCWLWPREDADDAGSKVKPKSRALHSYSSCPHR